MRIVAIVSAPAFGGGEQYLLDLITGLRRKGHSVMLAANPTIASEFRQRGVEVRAIPIGRKLSRGNALQIAWFPARLLYMIAWLFREHRRAPIDVVHCQYKKEQVLVSLAARCLGLRLIWTEHGPLPGFVGGNRWLVAAYRRLSRLPEKIIAVSQATRANLVAHGVDGEKIVTIYNGVAVDPLDRQFRPPVSGRLLAIGRLIPGKGHALLIRAMPRILAEAPNSRLVIAGAGPLAEDLAMLVRELNLEANVKLLGHVGRAAVRREIEASSVIVMPSVPEVGGEGLPYAIVEAMERGRPVVATRTGGIPEMVEDGKTGILVDDCTPDGFAAAIIRLLRNPLQAGVLSRSARLAMQQRFSLCSMIDATESVLATNASTTI